MSASVAVPSSVGEFEAARIETYKRDLSQTRWLELSGFWTDKTAEQRKSLWSHYKAAEKLVNLTYMQPDLVSARQEHEAKTGLTWRQISYAPHEQYDENDPAHSTCAVCDSRAEEIAEAKAKCEVYFAPPHLAR